MEIVNLVYTLFFMLMALIITALVMIFKDKIILKIKYRKLNSVYSSIKADINNLHDEGFITRREATAMLLDAGYYARKQAARINAKYSQ